MTSTPPEPRQIDSWQLAERNAADWMRHWGYQDAQVTPAGADGGIDVRAKKALAQVKFEAKQVGAPVLQRLLGAAARDESKRLFFFTGAGYAQPALDYAEDVDIALFTYDLNGRMTAVSGEARAVLREHEQRGRDAARAGNAKQGTSDNIDHIDGGLACVGILALVMILLSLIMAAGAAYRVLTGSDQPSGLTFVFSLGVAIAFAWSIVAMPSDKKKDDRTTWPARLWPIPWVTAFSVISYNLFRVEANDGGITFAVLAGLSALLWVAGPLRGKPRAAKGKPRATESAETEQPASPSLFDLPVPDDADPRRDRLAVAHDLMCQVVTKGEDSARVESSGARPARTQQVASARDTSQVARSAAPVTKPVPIEERGSRTTSQEVLSPEPLTDAPRPPSVPPAKEALPRIPLAKVAAFSRIRIVNFGSVDQVDGVPDAIDDVVPVWTRCERDENPFATVEVRGVIDSTHGLVWLPDDAIVEVVEGPRYAGQPEELVKQAKPRKAPEGSRGVMMSAEGWPSLVWESDLVHSPAQGLTDPEIATEVLMCALAVAPDDDPELRPILLASLKARYAHVRKKPGVYPPEDYPWRGRTSPGEDMLEYLEG